MTEKPAAPLPKRKPGANQGIVDANKANAAADLKNTHKLPSRNDVKGGKHRRKT